MHASALTRIAGMALAATMLVLTSGLADVKLSAPTEGQKAQADLAKIKAAQGDKVAVLQTCKAQDKAAASYQAGDKITHTQSSAPRADPGPFVTPIPAASVPAPTAGGRIVGPGVAYSSSDSTIVRSPSEP